MRSRAVLFAALVLLCALGTAAAVRAGMDSGGDGAASTTAATRALDKARDGGGAVTLFRDPDSDGQVGLVSTGDVPGKPAMSSLHCDRIYYAGGAGLCLARGGGFAAGYQAKVLGSDLQVEHELDVPGIPSRARVSKDGRYGSVTLFVTGHSYADAGTFSTDTTLIDMGTGAALANLEDFRVSRDGRPVTAVDVNFWGVTFARDSDRFYATMATGGKTYLIEGSVSARTARVLHENVECPSLSPDETRVAYKQRTGSTSRPWRLAVLDLKTMRETPLAEPRSIDDQAEWLDDDTVLYGTEGEISAVPADGSGAPRPYLAHADSPAVVRF